MAQELSWSPKQHVRKTLKDWWVAWLYSSKIMTAYMCTAAFHLRHSVVRCGSGIEVLSPTCCQSMQHGPKRSVYIYTDVYAHVVALLSVSILLCGVMFIAVHWISIDCSNPLVSISHRSKDSVVMSSLPESGAGFKVAPRCRMWCHLHVWKHRFE